MEDWLKFKLEAQRLLASAVGANDDRRPGNEEDWAAWEAERNAYFEERQRSLRRFLVSLGLALAVVIPGSWIIGTQYGNRIRAALDSRSLRSSTAICANQQEMLKNVPIGDYRVIAVLGDGPLANCQWMTDDEYATLKAKPGFRQLSPD